MLILALLLFRLSFAIYCLVIKLNPLFVLLALQDKLGEQFRSIALPLLQNILYSLVQLVPLLYLMLLELLNLVLLLPPAGAVCSGGLPILNLYLLLLNLVLLGYLIFVYIKPGILLIEVP